MKYLLVERLTKRFPGTWQPAVHEIDLEVRRGELLALIGESGSGKTTLLRLIAGFEPPTAGRIVLEDREIEGRAGSVPPEQRNLGLVFQEAALFPHLDLRGNIAFGLHTLPNGARAERVDEMLDLMGLADLGHRYPHEISGGQAQRAALARAMAPRPALLLLDEPFANLDPVLGSRLLSQVRDIFERTGTTAIFVTHERNAAFAFAHRVAILKDGSILQIGGPREIYEAPGDSYVATFVGKSNLLGGAIRDTTVATVVGSFDLRKHPLCDGRVSVRPDRLEIVEESDHRLGNNRGIDNGTPGASGTITHITFAGEFLEVEVSPDGAEAPVLTVYVDRDTSWHRGQRVRVRSKYDVTAGADRSRRR